MLIKSNPRVVDSRYRKDESAARYFTLLQSATHDPCGSNPTALRLYWEERA